MAYMAVLNSPAYETGFAEPSSAEARELKNAKRGYRNAVPTAATPICLPALMRSSVALERGSSSGWVRLRDIRTAMRMISLQRDRVSESVRPIPSCSLDVSWELRSGVCAVNGTVAPRALRRRSARECCRFFLYDDCLAGRWSSQASLSGLTGRARPLWPGGLRRKPR